MDSPAKVGWPEDFWEKTDIFKEKTDI
jgi:hypothetical protein